MKTLTLLSRTTLLAVALIGCGTDAITLGELIEAADDGNAGSPSDDAPTPSEPEPEPAPSEPEPDPAPTPAPYGYEAEAQAEAVRILRQYCGDCHAGIAVQGDLGNIDDVDEMIATGRIIPGSKEDSSIYARMVSRTMPPAFYQGRPSDTEILFIGEFIDSLAE